MPLYDYRCPACSSVVSLIRSVDDRDFLPICFAEGCDGDQEMERVLSAPSLSFKGTGWTPKFHRAGGRSE